MLKIRKQMEEEENASRLARKELNRARKEIREEQLDIFIRSEIVILFVVLLVLFLFSYYFLVVGYRGN
jgi:t-SNARE complex subunit (syntaxin)